MSGVPMPRPWVGLERTAVKSSDDSAMSSSKMKTVTKAVVSPAGKVTVVPERWPR